MFTFADNTNLYRRIGLALLLAPLNVFIAGMPPFQAGIWVQSEPAVFVLFIAAALTGLWLAFGVRRGWLLMPPTWPPLMLCLFAWVLWQIVITAQATLPLRSWFGPPQTGDGTGMSIAMILTIMLACPIWQDVRLRRILMIVVSVSLFVQCALHVVYPEVAGNPYMPERWVPAEWPEYLAFFGGYMWVAAFIGGYITNKKRYGLLLLAMILLLADSHNRSAAGFFAIALLLTTIAECVQLPDTRTWRKIMILACVAPLLLVLFSPIVPTLNPKTDPTGIINLLARINEGIGARLGMDQVALSALQHEPSRLIIGNGWGGYNDDLFKYALVDGVYAYKNGDHKPNWFLLEGSSHHSHNQPLEALLSLGIIGIILWYAVPMIALWTLPSQWFWPCAPMIVALTCLGHFWFQLPQCFPYQALYLAALIGAGKGDRPKSSATPICIAAFVISAFLMALSASGQYTAMMHGDRLHDAIILDSYKDYSEEWLTEDFRFGGDRWMASAKFYASDPPEESAEEGANPNTLGWYTYFLHSAHQAAQAPQIGARASSMELHLLYHLFVGFDGHLFDTLRYEGTESFEDAVMRLTYKAPLRDDYTSAFLINLPEFTHNDIPRQMQILNRLLGVAPNHRGALWLLGRIYLNTPGKEEQGRTMLTKAIATHVEKVYPVTDAELKATAAKLALDKY